MLAQIMNLTFVSDGFGVCMKTVVLLIPASAP